MEYEILTTITCLAGNLFRLYLIYQFLKLFLNTEGSNIRLIIRIFCYTLYFITNSLGFLYFHWEPIFLLASNIMGIFICSMTYVGKWGYRLCAVVAISAINVTFEDLAYRLLESWGITHLVLISMVISDLLLLMILVVLQKIINIKKKEDVGISTPEWFVVIFIPGCSIFISAIVLDECVNEMAITAGGICLVLLNLFLFYLLDQIQSVHRIQLHLALLERQNQAYENQMKLLMDSEEKISGIRHDMKNHLLVLQQMAQKSDSREMQEYLRELIPFVEQEDRFAATGNPAIDSLINIKLKEAAGLGAKIKTELSISNNTGIRQKDSSILLGNLLDNALRALRNNAGERILFLSMKERQGTMLIKVENTHNETFVRTGDVFNSTKKNWNRHGIGLKNVKRVVEDYQGEMEITATEHFFSVEILLYLME